MDKIQSKPILRGFMGRNYMKLARYVMISFLLIFTHIAFSQNKSISINVVSQDFSKVIEIISKTTEYSFVYKTKDVDTIKNLTLNLRDVSITKLLNVCLNGTDLSYEIDGNVIILKNSPKPYWVTFKGFVKNRKGEELVGATLFILGSDVGAVTDAKGYFNISYRMVSKKPVDIRISYIGMKTKIISSSESETFSIVLEEESVSMDDAVVTGYQIIDRRRLTSAVTSVKMDDIIIQGVNSVDNMLEGRIPDLMLTINSGEVGVVPKIRIRGTSTLIGNREPLWVVDGIVVTDPVKIAPEELNDPDYINRIGNAIAGINPQDISRIDVLKDASATALYGTKAANGVIVITTKKGRLGKPQVRYNMGLTFKTRPRYTDRKIYLMNSKQRIDFSRNLVSSHHVYSPNINLVGYEGLISEFYDKKISQKEFNNKLANITTMNTDWFDLLTRDALSYQHTISISGGNQLFNYYSSVGYVKDDDVIPNNSNNRYTATLNVDSKFSERIKVAFSLKGNVSKRKYYQSSISPINYAYNTSRAIPVYDKDGNYYYYKKSVGLHKYNYNILNELENSATSQMGSGISFTGNISYDVNDWLKALAILSYSTQATKQSNYWGENTNYMAGLRLTDYGVTPTKGSGSLAPFGGEYSHNDINNDSYTARLQLDANKYLDRDNKHNISANLGFEISSSSYDGYSRIDRGYYKDRGLSFVSGISLDDYYRYKEWVSSNTPRITNNISNIVSAYLSASYTYDNIITFNANTRIDGSNKFGSRSNEKLLPIFSVSTAYNIWKHIDRYSNVIDDISFRASYGYQGNMLDGQSPQMIIKKLPKDPNFNEFQSVVKIYPNPDLRWEKTNSFNIGLDFSLLNRGLQISYSYYYKKTTDAFLRKSISTVNGIGQYVVNSGTIYNSGFSIDITANPIHTKDFRWTISTSISKMYNKMNTLPSGEQFELEDFLDGTALVKGYPVSTFWSYKFVGLNPIDGGPVFDDMEDRAEELIGKSKYDLYTMVLTPSGSREPLMQGNITNTIRYKNMRLGISLAYSLGSKIRLFKLYNNGINFDPEQNVSYEFVDRWRRAGDEDNTNIPNIINGSSASSAKYITHWSYNNNSRIPYIAKNAWDMYNYANHRVVNGDYLKCTNMSFEYDFATEEIGKFGLSGLSLTFSARNIFTIASSKLRGQTPVQSGFAEIQLSERPSFSFGLNITL